jgi:hypothetical protein
VELFGDVLLELAAEREQGVRVDVDGWPIFGQSGIL